MERTSCIFDPGLQSHHPVWSLWAFEEESQNRQYSSLYVEKSPVYDLVIFLIGALSKIIATIVTYPYTLVRTKQHVNKVKG